MSITSLEQFTAHQLFPERESTYIRWYPKTLTPTDGVEPAFPREPDPEGIYIHVPFCDRLCLFCPFNKRQTRPDLLRKFLLGLRAEIRLYAQLCGVSRPLRFIYFGGGTPSVLTSGILTNILSEIASWFPLADDLEVTLESHPTHLTPSYVHRVREAGITRISSGVQGFDDRLLQRIGAQHQAADSHRAIESVAGELGGIAIDLLFRCPGQSLADWQRQLEIAIGLPGVSHVSCYSLVLEASAAQPDPHVDAEMTLAAHRMLEAAGFAHYASCASGGFDFARPGMKCAYEERHWGAPQSEFLGLGPGALGFVGGAATVNGLSVDRYEQRLTRGRFPLVSVTGMSVEEEMRRYFVLGVKTLRVPFAPFRARYGVEPRALFAPEIERLATWGFTDVHDDELVLTELGRLFVDSVSEVFFSREERNVPHPEEPEIRAIESGIGRGMEIASPAGIDL